MTALPICVYACDDNDQCRRARRQHIPHRRELVAGLVVGLFRGDDRAAGAALIDDGQIEAQLLHIRGGVAQRRVRRVLLGAHLKQPRPQDGKILPLVAANGAADGAHHLPLVHPVGKDVGRCVGKSLAGKGGGHRQGGVRLFLIEHGGIAHRAPGVVFQPHHRFARRAGGDHVLPIGGVHIVVAAVEQLQPRRALRVRLRGAVPREPSGGVSQNMLRAGAAAGVGHAQRRRKQDKLDEEQRQHHLQPIGFFAEAHAVPPFPIRFPVRRPSVRRAGRPPIYRSSRLPARGRRVLDAAGNRGVSPRPVQQIG